MRHNGHNSAIRRSPDQRVYRKYSRDNYELCDDDGYESEPRELETERLMKTRIGSPAALVCTRRLLEMSR